MSKNYTKAQLEAIRERLVSHVRSMGEAKKAELIEAFEAAKLDAAMK